MDGTAAHYRPLGCVVASLAAGQKGRLSLCLVRGVQRRVSPYPPYILTYIRTPGVQVHASLETYRDSALPTPASCMG